MQSIHRTRMVVTASALLLAALLSSHGFAQNIDFEAGNGTDEPNAFPGKGGAGWKGAWDSNNKEGDGIYGEVMDTDPILRSGNYLHVAVKVKDDAKLEGADPSSTTYCVRRRFYGVDALKPMIIEFDLRIDIMGEFEPKGGDRFFIALRDSAGDGGGTDSSFYAEARRAGGDTVSWHLYDGSKDDGDYDNKKLIDVEMPVEEGGVYHFTVRIDPINRIYHVTIKDMTGKHKLYTSLSKKRDGFGFRGDSREGKADSKGKLIGYDYLHFGARMSKPSEVRAFSLDNISVRELQLRR